MKKAIIAAATMALAPFIGLNSPVAHADPDFSSCQPLSSNYPVYAQCIDNLENQYTQNLINGATKGKPAAPQATPAAQTAPPPSQSAPPPPSPAAPPPAQPLNVPPAQGQTNGRAAINPYGSDWIPCAPGAVQYDAKTGQCPWAAQPYTGDGTVAGAPPPGQAQAAPQPATPDVNPVINGINGALGTTGNAPGEIPSGSVQEAQNGASDAGPPPSNPYDRCKSGPAGQHSACVEAVHDSQLVNPDVGQTFNGATYTDCPPPLPGAAPLPGKCWVDQQNKVIDDPRPAIPGGALPQNPDPTKPMNNTPPGSVPGSCPADGRHQRAVRCQRPVSRTGSATGSTGKARCQGHGFGLPGQLSAGRSEHHNSRWPMPGEAMRAVLIAAVMSTCIPAHLGALLCTRALQ
jgi:hypothetical protein